MEARYIVWKNYQRRPEVLAPVLDAQIFFFPHLFKSKYLRPLDYLIKLLLGIKDILFKKTDLIFAQCPPTYSVLPAYIMGIPYIIDAHNPLFQVELWQKLPFAKFLINNAKAIIVHNQEIAQLAKKLYPKARLFTIPDPVELISTENEREANQILVIASFDPWDEPVELLLEVIKELKDFEFIVTADVNRVSVDVKQQLQQLKNVNLTGFLPVKEYHSILCSSQVALVLTSSEATQPSGACEALSSDTPLIVSKTSLTSSLFGDWAILVDNSKQSIVKAVRSLKVRNIDLSAHRKIWNSLVEKEIFELNKYLDQSIK